MLRSLLVVLTLLLGTPLLAQSGRPSGDRAMAAYAERPAIGTISGVVVDSASGESLAFATVALYSSMPDSLVGGAITDAKGRFTLTDVRVGPHRLEVSYLGYGEKSVGRLMVRPGQERVDAGSIGLSPAGEILGAVEVTAEREYMQIGIDRKIYSVDKDLTAQGGDAVDAMRNIPSLEVDIDGQVSMRGSSNVNILIDGKPSSLTGTDQAALLEQLPAASIDRIEVITNPSARFNPDGTAGIINVVLKRDRKKGLSGGLQAGAGTNDKYSAAGNINYRTKDINLFANYSWRDNVNWSRRSTYRETQTDDELIILDQDFYGSRNGTNHMGRVGLDWYLSPKTTVSLSGSLSSNQRGQLGSTNYINYADSDVISAMSIQTEVDDDAGWNADADFRLDRRFDHPDHQWTLDARYSVRDDEDMELTSINYIFDGVPITDRADFVRQNIELRDNQIWTVQTDYTYPHIVEVGGKEIEKWRLETGLQAIIRDATTDYSSAIQDSITGVFTDEEGVSNVFRLSEKILSGYASYRQSWGDWGLQAGLRVEQALTDPQLLTTGEVFDNDYFSLFPSFYFSRKMAGEQELQLNYSRRINRPRRWALNPFIDNSDPLNIRIGNPDLQPEYVHAVELNYVKRWGKAITLTSSLFFRQTDDVIRSIRTVDDEGVATSTYNNFLWQRDAGLELIAVSNPVEWLRFTASGTVFRAIFDAGNVVEGLVNENISWNIKTNAQLTLPAGFSGQVSFRYNGPGITAQGTFVGVPVLDLALRKELLNDKLSISVRVSDVLNQRRFGYTLDDANFYQESTYRRESRIGWLNLSYTFGKKRFDRRRNDSSPGFQDSGMDVDM